MKKTILAIVTYALALILPSNVPAEDVKEYNMVITLQNGTTITLGHNDIKNITFNGEEISIAGNVVNTIEDNSKSIQELWEVVDGDNGLTSLLSDYYLSAKEDIESLKIEIEQIKAQLAEKDDNNGNNDNKGDDVGDDNNDESDYVSTESKISQSPMTVTLYGFLRGVTKDTEVGFILSLSPEMKESESRTVKLFSTGGRFDSTIKGILDQETYYYKAYAKIDNQIVYGKVRSFTTEPLTYTINGKEFKVIKVDGGPYGAFSILQTEISVNDKITIGGIDLEMTLDCDLVDGDISLYESKKFIGNLLRKTGYAWRYPTSSEWQFAAEGGLKSKNYTYSGSDDIETVAWYSENCIGPQESALKKANELDIYDMSGNFAELTNDLPLKFLETHKYLNAEYYDWSKSQAYGGSWNDKASSCKTNSHEATQWVVANRLEGQKYAFRLVYSHDIHAFSDN